MSTARWAAMLSIACLVLGRHLAGPAPGLEAGEAPQRAAKIFSVHANQLADPYVFVSRSWDLARITRAFNTVVLHSVADGGNAGLLRDAAAAGLRVFIEFDKTRDFAGGRDISGVVNALVRQVRDHPGLVAGIRVADYINEFLDPETALGYLKATGGVFHREIPGVRVLVDVGDWELTCGYPGQASCVTHHLDRYRYERDDVLKRFYRSGYVDGFNLDDNLKHDDAAVQAKAWRRARAMFPPPFILLSASPELSFADPVYPYGRSTALRQVKAIEQIPLQQGADGVDLWAWHRPYGKQLRTFLNKDGSSNALWESMLAIANEFRGR